MNGRSVRSGGNVSTTLSCSANGIFAICCDLTRPTITRLARTLQSTRTRRRREQYMPSVAFCLRHFSADFIICTCEFEFRQAHHPAPPPAKALHPASRTRFSGLGWADDPELGQVDAGCFLAAAVIYAAYLPIALWLKQAYVPLPAPPGQAMPLFHIQRATGFSFYSPWSIASCRLRTTGRKRNIRRCCCTRTTNCSGRRTARRSISKILAMADIRTSRAEAWFSRPATIRTPTPMGGIIGSVLPKP